MQRVACAQGGALYVAKAGGEGEGPQFLTWPRERAMLDSIDAMIDWMQPNNLANTASLAADGTAEAAD